MQFSYVALFAVAAAPNAAPQAQCSVGNPQCCATTHFGDGAKKTGALVGLNDLACMVGISCQQTSVNIIGVNGNIDNSCKETPVCCTGTANKGLVQTGCTPISVN